MGTFSVRKNLLGKRFGNWTVLSDGQTDKKISKWFCRCDCGNIRNVHAGNLINGLSISCGKCNVSINNDLFKTKSSWQAMRSRCMRPKHPQFHNYGGRGISICEKWMTFEGFFEDMGKRPDGMTLDRINSNGNYEPSNCKWSSMKEQANNRGNNRTAEYNGKVYTVAQLAELIGIKYTTMKMRVVNGIQLDKPVNGTAKKEV